MLTRKDCEAIALAIKNTESRDGLIWEIITFLANDNPRFNLKIFREKSGLPDLDKGEVA